MVPLRLTVFLVVLSLSFGLSNPAWSEKPQTAQDEGISFQKKNSQDEESSKEQNLFFSPLKPNGNQTFLVLDPDGKSPLDYERFLAPLDELDKQPKR
jgi:hypothetical protein